jgi:hypothetical protein
LRVHPGGRLLVVAGGLGAVALGAWFLPHGAFWAGLALGAALCLAAAAVGGGRLVGETQGVRDAGRRTERALAPLRADGWHVRVEGGGLVVVGPGGVFVVRSVGLDGSAVIEDGVLWSRHEDAPERDATLPNLARQLGDAAYSLQDRTSARLSWLVDVRPVVVLWSDFPAGHGRLGGVHAVAGPQLVEWLREQPRRLAEVDEPAVRAALAAEPAA